jgi:hypothetical protein
MWLLKDKWQPGLNPSPIQIANYEQQNIMQDHSAIQ